MLKPTLPSKIPSFSATSYRHYDHIADRLIQGAAVVYGWHLGRLFLGVLVKVTFAFVEHYGYVGSELCVLKVQGSSVRQNAIHA